MGGNKENVHGESVEKSEWQSLENEYCQETALIEGTVVTRTPGTNPKQEGREKKGITLNGFISPKKCKG